MIDCRLPLDQFIERAVTVSQAGVDILQIRDKHRSTAEICEYATKLKSVIDPKLTTLIINDRVDIAASLDLGVHLGQDDLKPFHARKLISKKCLLGISTHSIAQAHEAVTQGADYIGCGPTFPSKTKSFEHFPGLPFLQEVTDAIDCPAFAIGGISLDRLDELFTSGIGRVAVSDAIWNAECPAKAATAFSTRLKSRAASDNQEQVYKPWHWTI